MNRERTNLADLNAGLVPDALEVVGLDLSYLELSDALPQLAPLDLSEKAQLIALGKPTFELHASSTILDGEAGSVPAYKRRRWRPRGVHLLHTPSDRGGMTWTSSASPPTWPRPPSATSRTRTAPHQTLAVRPLRARVLRLVQPGRGCTHDRSAITTPRGPLGQQYLSPNVPGDSHSDPGAVPSQFAGFGADILRRSEPKGGVGAGEQSADLAYSTAGMVPSVLAPANRQNGGHSQPKFLSDIRGHPCPH